MGHGVLPYVGSALPQRAGSTGGRSDLLQADRPTPSLADWRDLLALVVRGNLRRLAGRLGLLSVERQIALIEADLPELARLRAVVIGRGTACGTVL